MEAEFQYTDDEEEQDDAQVELENAYYNSKSLRDDVPAAVASFEHIIAQESAELAKSGSDKTYGPWSFKAMKQLVKLRLRVGDDDEKLMQDYRRLLECIAQGDVSPNAVEKGINGMLERIALAVYDATLQVFHPQTGNTINERLWFKTNLKYGQLLYEMNEANKLEQVLRDLQTNMPPEDSGSASSSTQSMEIYALQIQLYSRQKDHKRLRETFQKAMAVRGGIPHPRTIALIQELGGKTHMASREYNQAEKTFFQAFKSYDEAGDPSRLRCLKYLVLASMLHASAINPFDSQEARPYRDDPEIVAMTNLVQAFHANDIAKFERVLRQNRRTLHDEFINEHVQDLLRTIRTQVLERMVRPYRRISLHALAEQLNHIEISQVESLLTSLILNGTLQGKIDRVDMVL
ncbi:COP9 SigNalosome subunit 2, partial [Phaeodactylum tricornutum CCAP 1055/1]